ncbi:MAG: PepSY domain-containing protein [Candidatus Marinimicrobia bacterium]|nr:PepSY domain-containing protein [Candidatus Neomarinimicrobiota bacterium]
MFYSKENRKGKSLLFKLSKWIHKYVGLGLVFFLIWMSISGILLNHPKAISSLAIPKWAVPSHYIPQNWNRSSLTRIVYSDFEQDVVFASGKTGVWKSVNGGHTFDPFMEGNYPKSDYYRKTNDIYLLETAETSLLFAGNDYGLFRVNLTDRKWVQIPLEISPVKIVKFIEKNDQLLVISESDIYTLEISSPDASIIKNHIKQSSIDEKMPLVDFFFELHSGKLFGFPGQLLFDLAGIILFYLSFTALYTWLYPKKRKKDKKLGRAKPNPMGRKMFQFLLKYHLSLGIGFALFLFIFGVTGFFMRPPFLAALVDKDIHLPTVINHRHDVSWAGKIQNGMLDKSTDDLILATSEGFWKGSGELNSTFQILDKDWPIFVMGATVLKSLDSNHTLVGSFSGLYNISASPIDQMTGQSIKDYSSIRPGDFMVTGYFETPEKESFIFTHEQGVLSLPGFELNDRFQQPQSVSEHYKMPLWNYVFEIHNGRFFRGILGEWYILLLPIGSLLLVFITMSGVIDWLYHRNRV